MLGVLVKQNGITPHFASFCPDSGQCFIPHHAPIHERSRCLVSLCDTEFNQDAQGLVELLLIQTEESGERIIRHRSAVQKQLPALLRFMEKANDLKPDASVMVW